MTSALSSHSSTPMSRTAAVANPLVRPVANVASPSSMAFPHGVPDGQGHVQAVVHPSRWDKRVATGRVLDIRLATALDSVQWGVFVLAIYACPAITVQRGHLSVLDILAMSSLATLATAVSYWMSRRVQMSRRGHGHLARRGQRT